jgi:hypothetical protein
MNPMDDELVAAARRRILRELEREQAGASVVNNIGGGLPVTLREQMASAVSPEGSPEDDYYVAIRREANKKGGWDKMVKRFKAQKGSKPPTMEELFGNSEDDQLKALTKP